MLRSIEITTKKCEGCSNVPTNEGGATIQLLNDIFSPPIECTTNGLDSSLLDYFDDNIATFTSDMEGDMDSLGKCYSAAMNLDNGGTATISWGGQNGSKWSPKKIKIIIDSMGTDLSYDCTPPGEPVLDNNPSSAVTGECKFIKP